MVARELPESVVTTSRGRALRSRRGARAALAAWGEDVAAAHLEERGWQVVARNWATAGGEVDIVARDPDGVVVIVEVRTRASGGFGTAVESVRPAKVRQLARMALEWASSRQGRGQPPPRIDVIAVTCRGDLPPRVEHLVGVLR